jgi:hypothetical protein
MGILEERHLVIQIDPGIAGFSQYGSSLAGIDIGKEQIQFSLVATLALYAHGLAVRQPVHSCQINVLLGA